MALFNPLGLRSALNDTALTPYTPDYQRTSEQMDVDSASQLERGWESSGLGETANGLKSKALAAYRSGDDLLGASLEQQANDMSARAAQWAPTVQNFTDINGVGSAVDWAGGALGGLRTSVAPALGGLAGTVGGAAIGLGLRNPGLGARVGGYLGSALAGGKSEYDEAVANAMDDPTIRNTRSYDDINNAALVKGGANSLLEAAVPGKLSGDLVLGAGKHLAKKAALKTAAKEIGEAALTEGATEGVQSLVGQAAQNSLLGNDMTDFDYKQALNEGAAGAMGGIGMGAAGATNTMARSAMAGAPKDEAAGDKPKFNITDAIADAGGKLGELAGDVHGKVQDKLDDAALKKISDDFERLNKIKGGSTAVEDFDKGIPKEVLDGPDADLVKYDNDSVEQMASTILNGDKREYTDAQRSAAAAYFADKNTSAFRASMKAAGKEKVRQEAIDELRDILPKHSKQMIDSAQPTSVTDEGAVVTKLAELWRKNEGKKFDPIFDESDNARVIASGLMEWVRSGYGAAHNDGEPMMPTKLIKALGDGAHKAIASMTDYLSKQGQLSKDVLAQRNDVEKEIKRLSMSDSNDMGVLQNNLRPITSTNWSAGKLNNLVSMLRDTKGEVSDKTKKVLGEDFNNIDDIIAHFSDPSRYTKQVASEVKGMGGKSKATLATQVTDSDNIGLEESAHDGEGEFYDATPTTTNGVSYHGAGGAKAKDLKPFDMNRPDGPAKMQAVKDAQKNNMGAVVEVVGARDHAVDTAENVRDSEDAVLEKFGPSLKDDGVLGDLVKNWASGHMTVDDLSNKQRDTLLNLINGQFKYVRVEQADSGVDHRHIAPKDVANYRVEYKDKASGYANRNKDEETADKGFLYLERTQGGKTTEFPTRASRFMTAGEFAKANADQSDHTVAGERNRGALGKYNQLLNGLSNLIVSDGTFTGRVGYRPTPGADIVWLKDVDTAAREVENFKLRDDSAQERMSSGKNMVAAAPLPSNLPLSKTETIADARARALDELYAEEKGDVGESRLMPRDFTPPFLTSATEKKSYVEGLITKVEDRMAAAVKSAGDNKFLRQQALAKAQWRAAAALDLVVFDEEGQLVDPSVTLAQIVESGAPAINRYYQSQRAASAMMTEAWDTDYGDVGNIGGGHIGLSPTMQKALNRLEKWRAERSAEYKKNPSEDLALRLSAIEHMIGLIELKREFTSTKDMRENQDKVFEARRRKQSEGVIEEESDESGSIRSEDGRRIGNSEGDGYTAGGKAGSTSARGGRIEGARYAEAVNFERMRAAVAANPDARKRVGARIEKLAYRDFRGINSAAFVPMKATDEAKIKAMKPATERMMPRATDAVAKGNKLDTGTQPTKSAGREVNQLTPKEAAALKRVETAQQWAVDMLSRGAEGLLNAIGKMTEAQVKVVKAVLLGREDDVSSKVISPGIAHMGAPGINNVFMKGTRETIHQAKKVHETIASHKAEIKAKIKAREHEVKNGQATGRSDQARMDSRADSSAGEGSEHSAVGGGNRVVGQSGSAQGRLGQRDGASGNLAESDGAVRAEKESQKRSAGEVSTPEQRKAAEDYITRTLGDSVKTAFEDLGGFSGKWTPGHTKNTISLAINGDVLGAAFHESIHELFKMLKDAGSEKTRELLERVAMNPILNREIERMLDGHPEAQAQVRKSPEEAVAFMYQMYASGQLKLGPQTRGLFDMIKDFLMKVAGLVSDGIRAQNREAARKQNDAITAQHVLDAFFSGGAAKDGAVTAVTREAFAKALEQHVSQHEAANKNIGKSFDDLARKAGRVVFSAEAMMDLTNNKHVIGLARQFNQKAGEAMTVSHSDNVGEVRGSFFDGVRHETDKYMNRLRHLMEGYDPKDMEMARKFMSTRKDNDLVPPTDRVVREIVRKMDAFFSEMGKYMAESDIRRLEHNDGATPQWVEVQMRKNYWPRVFDTDYLMKNGDKFVAALMTHHKAELEAIVKKANAEVKNEASAGNNSASGKALAEGKVDVALEDVAQAILARMLNGGTIDLAETETSLGMTPAASAVNQRELTFLNMEHFDEFVSKDTVNIMSTYARNMVKRGEYQKRFGYGGEKIATAMDKAYLFEVGGDKLVKQAEDALPDALADWNKQAAAWHKSNPGEPFTVPRPTLRSIGIGQHANVVGAKKAGEQFTEAAKKLDPASKAVQAFEGTLGNDISPSLRAMNSWMVTYQNFRLLSTMLFTSFQDVNGVVINGGDMKDAWNTFVSGIKAIKQSVSKNNPPDAQMKRAEEWGTVDAGSSLDALGQAYGSVWMTGKAKKLSDAFFKWTGAEGWNRGIRSYATQVAERTVMDWVQNGVDMKDPAAKARFERLYGKGATVADIKLDAFGGLDVLDQRNRAAINRWVLDAIPAPNASHRPIWGSDPRFQSFIHLKNYTYTWHRTILQSAIKSASMGDFRPGLVAALGYMPIAIAAGAIKEMLTPGEDPPWMQGGLDDYLSYGFARAGVLGVPQMYAGDLIEGDIARIMGPGWDQAQDLLSVPIFDDKYLGKELAGALPGGNLLKRAVPQGW